MVFLKESVEIYINIASYVPWHSHESMDWKRLCNNIFFWKNAFFAEIEVDAYNDH